MVLVLETADTTMIAGSEKKTHALVRTGVSTVLDTLIFSPVFMYCIFCSWFRGTFVRSIGNQSQAFPRVVSGYQGLASSKLFHHVSSSPETMDAGKQFGGLRV